MLSEYRKKGLLVVGTKQTIKAINENRLEEVFVAQDAEKYVIQGIEEAAENRKISITHVQSMKKLGKDCGIKVGAATAGILKSDR